MVERSSTTAFAGAVSSTSIPASNILALAFMVTSPVGDVASRYSRCIAVQ
jgi:hypothetical protein